MQSRLRLFGHAVHPMLVDFPIACLVILLILDVAEVMGYIRAGSVPILLVGVGGGSAVLAILTGLLDYFRIPKGTRPRRLANWHLLGGIVVWLSFGASSSGHVHPSNVASTLIDGVGVLIVIGQSWLGGELMERHHVGIRSAAEAADPVALR